jgi:methylenetetrahydrofolate reductase (NADPH)
LLTLVCFRLLTKTYVSLTIFLVHNDFHQTHGLFPLFDGLEVEDLAKEVQVPEMNGSQPAPNGAEAAPLQNGATAAN